MAKAIICKCSNRKLLHLPADIAQSLNGFSEVVYVDDLCSSVIENPQALVEICDKDSLVLACHTRAVEALLDYAKVTALPKIFDFRTPNNSDFATYIKSLGLSNAEPKVSYMGEKSNAWYPCIDYKECVNCSKCLDFCIFGVYEKVDGKVTVVAPTNCKDNCPACARTCPKSAVIFPKCPDLKISGKSEEQKKDEDFYDLLKSRRSRRVLK